MKCVRVPSAFLLFVKFGGSSFVVSGVSMVAGGFVLRNPSRLVTNLKWRIRNVEKERIFYLHVSKTAGTALADAFSRVNKFSNVKIKRAPHEIGLYDIPDGARYFFSTRDPIERFRSGFYCRLEHRNDPRHKWTPQEHRAFADFPHANDLAEALFSESELGRKAACAMLTIQHPARNFVQWFRFQGYALVNRPPIWIIRLETLEEDFRQLLARIGVTAEVDLKRGNKIVGKGDYEKHSAPDLSDLAKENLRQWYRSDFEFLKVCDEWIQAQRRIESS